MWLFLACSGLVSAPAVAPADPIALAAALTGSFAKGPLDLRVQALHTEDGYAVRSVRFSLQPGFDIAGALWSPTQPNGGGVLVAHGHYGQGKSSPEAQEIAHRLAARGYTVLAVDTPGVEEWDVPGRRIHFREGAHNRAFLAAGGSSTLQLQLDVLRRGVDVLVQEGAQRIVATGASGGAVLSFFLQLSDGRVGGSALAAFPRIPREARAGGCPCDQIPGWPGPDPSLLASLAGPSLWMSDVERQRPAGLPPSATFVVDAGPHSYTRSMQDRAIRWIDDRLGGDGPIRDTVPLLDLSTGKPDAGAMRIVDLQLSPDARWTPTPSTGVPYTLSCAGTGPAVVIGGGVPADAQALAAVGFQACTVGLITGDESAWSSLDLEAALSSRTALADTYAGAMATAVEKTGAVGAWGVRAWGLAAAGAGVPFVVRDPVARIDEMDPARDPPWVHVPGAWWGSITEVLGSAVTTGTDADALAAALHARIGRKSP